LFAVFVLVVPALIILLNGLRRPVCDPVSGTLWLLILSAPTAWIAATMGALVRFRVRRTRWAITAVAAIEVVSLAASVSTIYTGPVYFVFDHLFGYFPGPLYDETILVSPALLSFRAATIGWGAAAVAVVGALGSGDRASRRMHASWAIALGAALLGVSPVWGTDLGWRTTDRSLAKALGGETRIDRLELHYPRDWTDRQIEELVRDATFGAARVEEALGVMPSRPVRVWMYRSIDEKRRLVGAAATSFAKPWRYDLHIHARAFPHTSLRHELIHAIGAEVATGPWRVPGGVIPNAALTEGLAVAYDVDDDGLSLDQWAKAMRDLKLAPNLTGLLSPHGFYKEAPSRAYTYAGAFIRFLDGRLGRDAVRTLYRTGNLTAVGNPDTLIHAFERSLDTVTIDPDARATATRRFSRPSVFGRTCAREVSELVDEANRLAINREWDDALAALDNACRLQPEDPGLFRAKLSLALRAKSVDTARVRAFAEELWRHQRLDPTLEAASRLDVGDDLWRRGDIAGARAQFDRAGALPVDPAVHRATVVRLRALADPRLAALLQPFLVETEIGVGQLFRMKDDLDRHPDAALVGYLLGRQLAQRSAAEKGAEILERVSVTGLGDPELDRENLRVLVRAYAERHECDAAERTRLRLRSTRGSAADDAVASDWVARCRFEVARGWRPL
jgi:hypothetical protein